jgi:hypothetical protein
MTGAGKFKVRLALLFALLIAFGLAGASGAQASSVTSPGLAMYNAGTAATSAPAGSTRGFWLNFTLSSPLVAGQTITIQGPTGAVFPSGRLNYPIYVMGGSAYLPASTTAITNGVRLNLDSGTTLLAGQTITITMPFDKSNLIGVGTSAGSTSWSVSTQTDTTAVSTPSYTIDPGPVAVIGIPGGGAISATVGTTFSNSGQAISAYDQYFNPIPGAVINLSTPNTGASGTFAGSAHTTSVTMLSSGQALIPTTTANTIAGSWDITASASGATSKTIPRVNDAGPAASISTGLSPTSITANGTSQSTATVTVADIYGNRRSGDTVTLATTAGGPSIGAVAPQGNGVYTAALTSSTTAGNYSITATDTTPNPDVVATPVTLTQAAGALHHIGVPSTGLSATVGQSFSGAGQVLFAYDQFNNPIPSQQLNLTTPATGASGNFVGGGKATSVTTNSSGYVSIAATIANSIAGSWLMTISGPGGIPSNTVSRTNLAGAPHEVSLSLAPESLPADGSSTATATAHVADNFGNPISGQAVSFQGSGGQTTGSVTDHGDGSYSTTVKSTTTPGDFTVTATDSTPVTPITSSPATLHQTMLPATAVTVELSPTSIPADGTSTSTATVSVANALGNPVTGDNVTVNVSGGQQVGTMTDNGDGTYSATITSTTTPGSSSVTATDSSPVTPVNSDPVSLEQIALPATEVKVHLDSPSIPADGSSKSTVTVSASNALGDPVSGDSISIKSSGAQQIGAVTDHGDGTYTAQVTASTVAGSSTITATDSSPSPSIKGSATLTQTSVTPPPTVIKPVLKFVKAPKKKVKKVKVKFRFKVVKGKAKGFQCKLDRKKWTKCKSPKVVKLKRGKHTFRVRGVATNGTFGKPIVRRIKRI